MSVTEQLCQTICDMTFDNLPSEAIAVAKQVILDGIAVGVAGAAETGPRLMAEQIQQTGGKALASVLGMGFKTSPVSAATINGMSMHVLDYEPMWSPPTHATSPALPTVLALAESEQVTGREVITAFVKGCESQGRIRLASQQYAPRALSYHPPGVVGGMGAAVAASHLLPLEPNALRHAMGITASRAGGVMANVGTMTKALHCGGAGAGGFEAALLAQRGFTGNADIFDAVNGYVDVFFGEAFDDEALLAYGRPFRVVDPGFAIKMFPSQYATHFGITAALQLHHAVGMPEHVESVEVVTPIMPYVDRPEPETGLEGKFSFQYTVAAALLDGNVRPHTFTDTRRFAPDMSDFLAKISLHQTEDISPELEHMRVDVTITHRDGQQASATCTGPRGFWGLPRLTHEEHLVKIRDCLSGTLSTEDTERCIALAAKLETLEAKEVCELIALAGAG